MVYYLDTSALVKRYVAENGSQWMVDLCQPTTGNLFATALLSKVEAAAAFAIKLRQNSISARQYNRLLQVLDSDFSHEYQLVPIDETLVNLAIDLTKHHKLRGYDAVQLAAALTLQNRLVQAGLSPLKLIAADIDLLNAAQREELIVDDPNLHP